MSHSGPKVSVIIPAHDSAEFITETLESVLGQSWRDLEVLVIDDGSEDQTGEVACRINDPRLRYLRQAGSGGPARPRNVGIRHATGEIFCFFDSDDIMAPDKIARQVAFMQETGVGMSATNFRSFIHRPDESQGRFLDSYRRFQRLRRRFGARPQFVIPGGRVFDLLLYENFIGTSGVMVRREVMEEVGLFDETLQSADDFDMWLRISRHWDVGFLDMVGHYYRLRPGGISLSSRRKVLLNRIQVVRKRLDERLSLRQEEQARRLIGSWWLGLGYEFKEAGDMESARDYFRASFRTWAAVSALRAYLSTWLQSARGGEDGSAEPAPQGDP